MEVCINYNVLCSSIVKNISSSFSHSLSLSLSLSLFPSLPPSLSLSFHLSLPLLLPPSFPSSPCPEFELLHVDEFIDELLRDDRVCDIILPRIQKRYLLEQNEQLEPRISALDDDLSDEESEEEEEPESDHEREKERERERRRSPSPAHRHHNRERDRKRSRSRSPGHRRLVEQCIPSLLIFYGNPNTSIHDII